MHAAVHPIEFEGVTKRYGSRTVLQDLSFSVPQGSVVGLLGPNGAGKSTAMRVLLGLQKANGGTVRLLGNEPGTAGYRNVLKRVGSIIEAPPLFRNATAMENLEIRVAAIGLSVKQAEVREILNRVNLAERADDKVGNFSLGMRQRVGLALAMVGDPSIIVLDEPTNGLDPAGAVEIRELVRGLPERGATALVCTHRLEEVEKSCDYVVVLRRGHLIAQGSMADIIASADSGAVTVEVRPDEAAGAVQALAPLGVADIAVDAGKITLPRGVEDTSAITRLLADAGIYLSSLSREQATLEQAFLQLTGDEDGEAAA